MGVSRSELAGNIPAVSVVIPTYNCGWCVGAALQSVLAQTFSDYEIIVVDDGSTDATRERVQAFSDARVRYIYQPNSGRSAARNKGIAEARGEFVAFLDADDLWLPGKLEAQVALLRAEPTAIMAYSPLYEFRERNPENGEVGRVVGGRLRGSGLPGAGDRSVEFLLQQVLPVPSATIVNRSILNEVGAFDTRYAVAEDWDLLIRLACRGAIAYDREPLAAYWVGRFASTVEWERTYGGYHELIRVYQNLLSQPAMADRFATFAAQAMSGIEWCAALFDVGLGKSDCATRHIESIESMGGDVFFRTDDRVAPMAVEEIVDESGLGADEPALKVLIRERINLLAPQHLVDRLYSKALGYLYARTALFCYRDGELRQGFTHAARAALYDRRWLSNRGLWTTPLRRWVKSRMPKRVVAGFRKSAF